MKNQKTIFLSKKMNSGKLFLAAFIIGAFVIAGMFQGCYKDSVQPTVIPYTPHSPNDTAATVHYSTDIQPALNTNCVGCHSEFSSYGSLMAVTPALVNTATPSSSIIYLKIHSGTMAAYAPAGFDAKILTWITEGAHNN